MEAYEFYFAEKSRRRAARARRRKALSYVSVFAFTGILVWLGLVAIDPALEAGSDLMDWLSNSHRR